MHDFEPKTIQNIRFLKMQENKGLDSETKKNFKASDLNQKLFALSYCELKFLQRVKI